MLVPAARAAGAEGCPLAAHPASHVIHVTPTAAACAIHSYLVSPTMLIAADEVIE
jgi:hypothetical protein